MKVGELKHWLYNLNTDHDDFELVVGKLNTIDGVMHYKVENDIIGVTIEITDNEIILLYEEESGDLVKE
jgi:proteasome assembly chaperone (PAC2) family protein